MPEKFGPCLDKNCSHCCDPVKIEFRKGYDYDGIPLAKDKNGNEIWERTGEVFAPEVNIDTVRVATFKCNNFDKESGKCLDYKNRPDICRNTSCIDECSDKNVDDQHKEFVDNKFIKVK
ncbi:MAG: YkgJ family cysteine cluster protein [Candidatus Falkowbacteria bacterium]